MRRELFVLVCASAIGLGATAACSSSSTTATNTGTDSGVNTHPATDDSGATGGDQDSGSTGDQDSGTVADGGFNGCTSYVDHTASAEFDIAWGLPYTADKCPKIKVGTVVKFTGDFGAHPLEKQGGDEPSPLDTVPAPDAGSISVTFANAGTFGYHCENHPSVMVGAFLVVP